MHNFILFALLFENIRIPFDKFLNDQFLARKIVKKTISFPLFWKAEMIQFQAIRIHRKQYKYLDDHFRGSNKRRKKTTKFVIGMGFLAKLSRYIGTMHYFYTMQNGYNHTFYGTALFQNFS